MSDPATVNGDTAPARGADAAEGFRPAVVLSGGWLPGASAASAAASAEAADHFWDRARLRPHTRAAIQLGVAAGLSTVVGASISGARFYWAVIAVIITFAGTANADEQVQKAAFRVAGTAAGVAAGSVIALLTGGSALYSWRSSSTRTSCAIFSGPSCRRRWAMRA